MSTALVDLLASMQGSMDKIKNSSEKHCNYCHQDKPHTEFPNRGRVCKPCLAIKGSIEYRNRKAGHRKDIP